MFRTDLMIHDIDILLHLVKAPEKISANGVAVMSQSPDLPMRVSNSKMVVWRTLRTVNFFKRMRKMRLFKKDAYIGIDF